MIRRFFVATAMLVAAVAAPAAWAADTPTCTLRFITSLDLDMVPDGRVRVPVTMNHQPFKMLVDTGAFFSIVSTRTTTVLNLKPQLIPGRPNVIGADGRKMSDYVTLDQFALGRLQAGSTELIVDPRSLAQYDGLFGEDFLSNYDLDFDFAKGKLNFVKAEGCTDGVVYWTKGKFGAVPFRFDDMSIKLQVMLDGKRVTAGLDTGTPVTTMNLEEAKSLFGIGEKNFPTGYGVQTFKSMSVGELTVMNPAVTLVAGKFVPVLKGEGRPMLIGMNVLRNLHVYISHKQKMVYVTPAAQY